MSKMIEKALGELESAAKSAGVGDMIVAETPPRPRGLYSPRVTLKWRRESLHMSQEELAPRLGVDLASYQAWEAATAQPAIPTDILDRLSSLEEETMRPASVQNGSLGAYVYLKPNIHNTVAQRMIEWDMSHPDRLRTYPDTVYLPDTYPEE
jgi:DNA-binding transcriptional regulator YiaG